MNLFDLNREEVLKKEAPLAHRIRPKSLDDFYGQEHIVGDDKLLKRLIKADKLSSILLYGPPGTGKTTLAKIISENTKSQFKQLNAVTAGIKDIKELTDEAKKKLGYDGVRTILFVDEIHRFNKTQQDALLPFVEDGTVIFIGATTENPYFEVNNALVSRSMVFELKPLTIDSIKKVINKAITDTATGLGNTGIEVTEDAIDFLSDMASGDARKALNALELAYLSTKKDSDGKVIINLAVAEECIQKRAINYDKNGDNHYDVISAFIKSMRGSDPDAALYYLARMIYAGEDPKFIARRIIICASEDVGNADPKAIEVAISCALAVERVGMPEGKIILAQAATYIACAPKSNAALGIFDAISDVEKIQIKNVPPHLKDNHSSVNKNNTGKGYKYPHDYPNHYVNQIYLPEELQGKIYYNPSSNGYEKKIKEFLEKLNSLRD